MKDETSIKNIIAKSLGAFWILDGLLQFQPQMFGANFVTQVLDPVLAGQPSFMHAIVAGGIFLWNINPPVADTLAALLQISIGVLLFFPLSSKKFKVGAWISIVWGTIVWLCGECAGLLFSGAATFYTGAPGAVLYYSVPAVFLLMSERAKLSWFPRIVGWTFIIGAALQLQSGFWSASGLDGSFMVLPLFLQHAFAAQPILANGILAGILLVFGLLILFKPNRTTAISTIIFLALVWWLGQEFGMLDTFLVGTATDPNQAPLLALLLLPLLASS
jgi:hypothetical protein